jgi:hypothetical protein
MDHNFVFNTLSFPAASKEEAYNLLLDSVKGMLAVRAENDRVAMYSDGLNECALATDFYYQNFIDQLGLQHEEDIQLSLMEIADKTPMFDFNSEELFNEIASSIFYFPSEAYTGSVDVLAAAWQRDATLFSIATTDKWRGNEIEFAKYIEGQPPRGSSYLRNISCKEHGEYFRQQYTLEAETPLEELFPGCQFSDDFLEWIRQLPKDVFKRVVSKVALASAKQFQGGEPLFNTLHDADGIRELRFSAVQGGAVRILFRVIEQNRSAILFGFIKKSDDEGYKEAIKAAKYNLNRLLQ